MRVGWGGVIGEYGGGLSRKALAVKIDDAKEKHLRKIVLGWTYDDLTSGTAVTDKLDLRLLVWRGQFSLADDAHLETFNYITVFDMTGTPSATQNAIDKLPEKYLDMVVSGVNSPVVLTFDEDEIVCPANDPLYIYMGQPTQKGLAFNATQVVGSLHVWGRSGASDKRDFPYEARK